jgi:hypothetical protein
MTATPASAPTLVIEGLERSIVSSAELQPPASETQDHSAALEDLDRWLETLRQQDRDAVELA